VIDALVSGILAGYGVAVPVGAIAALLVSLTARTSLRVGASAALGVATADGIYAALAVLGGAAVTTLIRPVATPLRWAACLVLLALAGWTAWTAWRHHRSLTRVARHDPARLVRHDPARVTRDGLIRDDLTRDGPAGVTREELARDDPARAGRDTAGLASPGRAYLGLLGLTILNPATVIYFTALVLGRQSAAPISGAAPVVFVAAAFAASASWQLLLAGSGSLLGRVLTGPRGRFLTAVTASLVIAVLALKLVV
jgi:arginine exporter protein ArgO